MQQESTPSSDASARPSQPGQAPPTPSSSVKASLRGKPFAEQEAALKPTDGDRPTVQAGKDGESVDTTGLRLDVSTVHASGNGVRERRTVGVGEPVDITPTISGGHFSCAGGHGAPSEDPAVWRWVAPNRARQCTVTYVLGGVVKSLLFEVVEPSGVHPLGHTAQSNFGTGEVGVGMYVPLVIQPADVSFGAILSRETKVDGEATGFFTTRSAGWLQHKPAPAAPIHHSNRGINDHASYHLGETSSWAAGTWDWHIPMEWSMKDGSTGWKEYKTVRQHMTLADDGTATVSKYGQGESRKP